MESKGMHFFGRKRTTNKKKKLEESEEDKTGRKERKVLMA